MSQVMPGAEPFFYQGNDVGCLLMHGFTSTPQEMRRLGQFLHGCGLTVRGILVAGHGTQVQDLNATTWRDWYDSAYAGWRMLHESCAQVFAVGQSLGGALALHLAAHVPLSGVVAMATPLVVDLPLLWLARTLKYVMPYRKKGVSNIHDPQALAARVAYRATPTRSQEQVVLFLRHLRDDLPEVHAPALLLHSPHDKTVRPDTMPRIYERLGAADKQMLWLQRGGHVMTEDYDREFVYGAIRAFVERLTGAQE
jgi:carboxylesterase